MRVSVHRCVDQSHELNIWEISNRNFLDASSHLYKRVCPSICMSVRMSVRMSVTIEEKPPEDASYCPPGLVRFFFARHKRSERDQMAGYSLCLNAWLFFRNWVTEGEDMAGLPHGPESRCKYWATCSFVHSFARTAHLFARSVTHSLPNLWDGYFCSVFFSVDILLVTVILLLTVSSYFMAGGFNCCKQTATVKVPVY